MVVVKEIKREDGWTILEGENWVIYKNPKGEHVRWMPKTEYLMMQEVDKELAEKDQMARLWGKK